MECSNLNGTSVSHPCKEQNHFENQKYWRAVSKQCFLDDRFMVDSIQMGCDCVNKPTFSVAKPAKIPAKEREADELPHLAEALSVNEWLHWRMVLSHAHTDITKWTLVGKKKRPCN